MNCVNVTSLCQYKEVITACNMVLPISDLPVHRTLIVRVVYNKRLDYFTVCKVTDYYHDDLIVTVSIVRAFRD